MAFLVEVNLCQLIAEVLQESEGLEDELSPPSADCEIRPGCRLRNQPIQLLLVIARECALQLRQARHDLVIVARFRGFWRASKRLDRPLMRLGPEPAGSPPRPRYRPCE